jgi:hypothetical protein
MYRIDFTRQGDRVTGPIPSLIAIPQRPDSMAKLILRVHSRYAQAFNRSYKRTGHRWHSRLFCCAWGAQPMQKARL